MAEVERKSKEDLEFDIIWETRAKKILLICTAICSGLGLIGGVAFVGAGAAEGVLEIVVYIVLYGIWLGPGLGGAVSLVPLFFRHQNEAHKRGEAAEERSFTINLILFLFFLFVGPLGLLVRILRINHRIKKFEKQLSELGQ